MAAGGRHFFSLVPPVVLSSSSTSTVVVGIGNNSSSRVNKAKDKDTTPLLPFYNNNSSTPTTHLPPTPTPSEEQEPPLLEELGIDIDRIRRKAISVLTTNPSPQFHANDPDLSGPLLILLAFALLQFLIARNFLLGVALWWFAGASTFLYYAAVKHRTIIGGHMMTMDLYRCLSLVGYSMLPLMVLYPAAVVLLGLPRGGAAALGLAMAFVAWSTTICVRLLLSLSAAAAQHGHGQPQLGLLLYPCCLIFMLLALLVIPF